MVGPPRTAAGRALLAAVRPESDLTYTIHNIEAEARQAALDEALAAFHSLQTVLLDPVRMEVVDAAIAALRRQGGGA